MPKALADGRVDALSVWEPNGFLTHKLMGQEALIFPSKNYYRETFNLVFSKEYIHKHPQLIVRTLKALHHAIQFIHQQPKQAQQILTRKLQLDNDFISWVWQDLNFQLSLDQSLIKTLETESEWAIKNNIVKKSREIDYTRYLYLDALTKVDSSMVTVIH
jgi:NitT/TauT family transport system substrate-binding protein